MRPYIVLSIGGFFAAMAVSAAGAQSAPIPNPPATVHPVPQNPKDCRGCSEADSGKTSVGKYDEKKPGIVRETVRPTVKAKPKVATSKPKKKTHSTKRKIVPKKIVHDSTVKQRPPLKDKPAIGDPIIRRIFPL